MRISSWPVLRPASRAGAPTPPSPSAHSRSAPRQRSGKGFRLGRDDPGREARPMNCTYRVLLLAVASSARLAAQDHPVTIRAARLLDGAGGMGTNALLTRPAGGVTPAGG